MEFKGVEPTPFTFELLQQTFLRSASGQDLHRSISLGWKRSHWFLRPSMSVSCCVSRSQPRGILGLLTTGQDSVSSGCEKPSFGEQRFLPEILTLSARGTIILSSTALAKAIVKSRSPWADCVWPFVGRGLAGSVGIGTEALEC